MAIAKLSESQELHIADPKQDCRGWPVVNAQGQEVGRVEDLLIDTQQQRVVSLQLAGGQTLNVESVSLRDNKVVLRQGGAVGAQPQTAAGAGSITVPVVEEQIRVGKREVEAGTVKVQTRVIERPVEESIALREEHVTVERHAVNRPARPEDLREGVVQMTATSEEAVVAKQARVVEEVVIGKQSTERVETVRDTVKRSDVVVERSDDARGFEAYEAGFREHYRGLGGASGRTYEQIAPAYRYGYDLARDDRYRGRDWSAVEGDARKAWESHNSGSVWADVRDAIRGAWDKVRGAAI